MKKVLFFLLSLFVLGTSNVFSQGVAINTDGSPPDPSAMLDVSSGNKGFLPPSMTTEQRISIENPADGLQVYDTDLKSPCYFNGIVWKCWDQDEGLESQILDTVIYVSNSDMSTLNTSPKQLLPAFGDGIYSEVLSIYCEYFFATTAYLSGNLAVAQGNFQFPLFKDDSDAINASSSNNFTMTPQSGRWSKNSPVVLYNLFGNPTTGSGWLDVHVKYMKMQ